MLSEKKEVIEKLRLQNVSKVKRKKKESYRKKHFKIYLFLGSIL